ncbi:MAG: hypothetical protein NC924_05385 [Candidatus Omnitrophica bacterium]|nr:hypothetical protein [Candidatus Omnitrophota bacterium]
MLTVFSVLFTPTALFKHIVRQRRFIPVAAAVMLAAVAFVVGTVYILRKPLFVVVPRSPLLVAQAVLIVFSGLLLSALVWSVIAHGMYAWALRRWGRGVPADYYAHFLCRCVVMPWWMVILALLIAQGPHPLPPWLAVALALLLCRVLDIEARLLDIVYNFSGILGYIVIFSALVFFSAGILLGAGIRLLITAAQ